MSDWYYVDGGAQAGPVDVDEMRGLVQTGAIDPDTYVWTSGMGDWERAGDQSWYEPPAAAGPDGPDRTADPGQAPPPGPPPPPARATSGTRHPSGVAASSRNWAMAAHLSGLAGAVVGLGLLIFVGPLVVWLVKRDEDPFVEQHAREALNFSISVLLYAVVCVLLVFVLVGIVLLLALGVFWLVVTIQAAVRASDGRPYSYPLNISFVSR